MTINEKLKKYEGLGTVEELEELKEKTAPKKIITNIPGVEYECPYCRETEFVNPIIEYCPWCGQKLDF